MIKPIRTKKDYLNALNKIDSLLEAKKGTEQFDELEIITILVEDYERRNVSILPPDPVEAIKFRMEQRGLTKKDLEQYIGSRARVSEIFNHKRELSLRMIRTLIHELGIPAEALVH